MEFLLKKQISVVETSSLLQIATTRSLQLDCHRTAPSINTTQPPLLFILAN
jgi:hypothetical protein